MANKPKTLDNRAVQDFLEGFLRASDLVKEHPRADDIFTGALEAKTAGDSSTRTLSRRTLFTVLQLCPTIDTASVEKATGGRYAAATVSRYTAVARVASKALERFVATLPPTVGAPGILKSREELDAPHLDDLRACGLAW
jgi:hypothetical protein